MRPRHVCFVNSMRSFGGAEVWMLDAALGLAERGHRLSIVAQPGTPLLARARRAGLTAGEVPIRFDGAPWTLLKLRRFFEQQGIEAVLCNLTKDLKAAGVAARLAGIRTVLALRESDFPLKNKLYYRWYFNRIASGLVVNSAATRTTVLQSAPWLSPGRVHLLYKGVDLNRFQPPARAPQAQQSSQGPAIGFVGQLIERKGLDELMRAWAMLERETWQNAPRLLIAGSGPLGDHLAGWRQTLRRPELVTALGYIERIERFLGGLAVLVMPSRAEGFGLAAAEASACGVPVVATRASSLPEIVQDGRTGLLVAPGDAEGLARAVRRLLADPELATRLGRQGRDFVSEHFSRSRMLDGLEQLIGG